MRTLYPGSWERLISLFAEEASKLGKIQKATRRGKKQIDEFIARIKSDAEISVSAPSISSVFSPEVKADIERTVSAVRDMKSQLAKNLDMLIDDYKHAEENEDRFVVLVFGEVNSGKSSLANHIAGFDFDLPAERRGACFVGNRVVPRLEECEIECTRDYQGFRLPGLLWIDCPGILSTTLSNSNTAHRLVSRSDVIILVSSSDNPIKLSELEELKKLIEHSGNNKIDACIVVTKVDMFDEDEDDTGRIIRKVTKKDKQSWQGQEAWCAAQLKKSGLKKYLRISEPTAVSVYVARDRMGRNWQNGGYMRNPPVLWEKNYEESGMPGFYTMLADMVKKHGQEIKK